MPLPKIYAQATFCASIQNFEKEDKKVSTLLDHLLRKSDIEHKWPLVLHPLVKAYTISHFSTLRHLTGTKQDIYHLYEKTCAILDSCHTLKKRRNYYQAKEMEFFCIYIIKRLIKNKVSKGFISRSEEEDIFLYILKEYNVKIFTKILNVNKKVDRYSIKIKCSLKGEFGFSITLEKKNYAGEFYELEIKYKKNYKKNTENITKKHKTKYTPYLEDKKITHYSITRVYLKSNKKDATRKIALDGHYIANNNVHLPIDHFMFSEETS